MPGIALLSLLVILAGGWRTDRSPVRPAHLGPKPDTVNHRVIPAPIAVQPATPVDGVDTVAIDTPYLVANPADSASSAAFAVELMAANTQAGAILKLQQDGKDLPAATFCAGADAGCDVVQGGQRRVRRHERDADSLLAR